LRHNVQSFYACTSELLNVSTNVSTTIVYVAGLGSETEERDATSVPLHGSLLPGGRR